VFGVSGGGTHLPNDLKMPANGSPYIKTHGPPLALNDRRLMPTRLRCRVNIINNIVGVSIEIVIVKGLESTILLTLKTSIINLFVSLIAFFLFDSSSD
jgi:hypothetical protein